MSETEGAREEGDGVQIIQPPNLLREKVGPGHSVHPNLIKRAEEAIARLGENYTEWVGDDLAALDAAIGAAREESQDRADHLARAYEVAHDMRGHAGTFGYTLITRIARSLCQFISAIETPTAKDVEIVRAHCESMRAVLANDVKGDGTPIAREIVETLEGIVGRTVA